MVRKLFSPLGVRKGCAKKDKKGVGSGPIKPRGKKRGNKRKKPRSKAVWFWKRGRPTVAHLGKTEWGVLAGGTIGRQQHLGKPVTKKKKSLQKKRLPTNKEGKKRQGVDREKGSHRGGGRTRKKKISKNSEGGKDGEGMK